MLSLPVLAHAQSCVIVARPADDEIEAVLFYPQHDLFDQHANDPFARGDGGSFGMLGALDIGAEPQQQCLSFGWARAVRPRCAERVEFLLEPLLVVQALVPPPLEFTCDQSVVGIDGVILPSGVRSLEARLFQRQLNLVAFGGVFTPTRLQSGQRRIVH